VREVLVVGGGVSGLAAANALVRSGVDARITLLESSARLGGNVATVEQDGFVLDGGPDSWVTTKPHATALARSLGLEPRFIPTMAENRRVYVAWKDGLVPLPEGMVLGIPTEVMPIVSTSLFSWDAKLRMALEPLIPARSWGPGEDESIGDFLARRLGDEVKERLAGPLLGGIFAGDASELSARAAFPQLVDAEVKHGSLVRAMQAMRAARKRAGGAAHGDSAFVSLRGGMRELIASLESAVRDRVVLRLAAGVERIEREGERYRVTTSGGEELQADDVVLATPLHVSSALTRSLDAELSSALGAFVAASTATVFLAYRRDAIAHALDATGFLVPRALGRPALASTWVSSKWAHRAPEGHALIRVFFGGATDAQVLERDDAELGDLAAGELRAIMGVTATPLFARVFRFERASPQPLVGHLGRVAATNERLARFPGLHVATNGFEGNGIPDCVKNAELAASLVARRGATAR
jgi:oxygen-dependent protoporphyrinogen oxidase